MDYWLGYIVRSSIVNGLINKFEKLIIILELELVFDSNKRRGDRYSYIYTRNFDRKFNRIWPLVKKLVLSLESFNLTFCIFFPPKMVRNGTAFAYFIKLFLVSISYPARSNKFYRSLKKKEKSKNIFVVIIFVN